MAEQWGFDALKVRSGYNPAQHNLSVAVPIYQATSSELGDVTHARRLISFAEKGFLIINVSRTTHRESTETEHRLADLSPKAIRLSIELEQSTDLISDLEHAFAKTECACCS